MFPLRPFQTEALRALEAPGHVICIAPTGAGKSLIFERFIQNSRPRTVLITPLVALARQQYRSLLEISPCVSLGAGGGAGGEPLPFNKNCRTEVWIVSPEALLAPSRFRAIQEWKPEFLIVDECHCLWEWGQQFRPAFSRIPEILKQWKIPRSLWLSATLPAQARRELTDQLPSPIRELGSFQLPTNFSLKISRTPPTDKPGTLLLWLQRHPLPGVIFVPTRDMTTRISHLVRAAGRLPIAYHAGFSSEERRSIEASIGVRPEEVIVSTSAFGMGMNYKHIQWVALWQPSHSLLSLTQAIGRAGRAPETVGEALVLWSPEDFSLMTGGAPPNETRDQNRAATELLQVQRFLETSGCREIGLSRYFENTPDPLPCGRCDQCDF